MRYLQQTNSETEDRIEVTRGWGREKWGVSVNLYRVLEIMSKFWI